MRNLLFCLILLGLTSAVSAQCETNIAPGLTCMAAPLLMQEGFENGGQYCSTLPVENLIDALNPLCPSGGVPNNAAVFQFIPASPALTFLFDPFSCDTIVNGAGEFSGLQVVIFPACDYSNEVFCASACMNSPFIGQMGSLIPGQLYTMVFDGCAGSVCSFSISLTDGELLFIDPLGPPMVNGPAAICDDQLGVFNISNLPEAAIVDWQIEPSVPFTTLNDGQVLQLPPAPGTANYGICAAITPPNGTTSDTCFELEIYESPTILSISNDTSLCTGDTLQLNLAVQNAAAIEWVGFGNTLSCSDCLNPTFVMDESSATFKVTLTNATGGCEISHSVVIGLNDASACASNIIEIQQEANFVIFPNPGQSQVMIRSEQRLGRVSMYNSLGQQVSSIITEQPFLQLDTEQLPLGVYYIHVGEVHGIGKIQSWIKQ